MKARLDTEQSGSSAGGSVYSVRGGASSAGPHASTAGPPASSSQSHAPDSAKNTWHAAVAKERKLTEGLSSVQLSLRNYVSATYGEADTVFSDFGFAPRAVGTVDVATKAEAAKKRAATRAARHTMGKRPNLDITGVPSPAEPSPTTTATPSAAASPLPSPLATNSQANAAGH